MITAAVLLALVAFAYVLGRTVFFGLVAVIVALALYEAFAALRHAGFRPNVTLGIASALALLVVAFSGRAELLAVVFATTMFVAFFLSMRPGRGATAAGDVAWTLLLLAWIGGGGAAAVGIMMLEPEGIELLIAFVLVAALDDVVAYFAGTAFGHRKLAPSISPGKSWEGLVAGFAAALAAGAAAGALLQQITALHGLVIGALCGVFVPVGDLVESLFKREMRIKDTSQLLPGHGGFLDRVDAIVFCAPVVFAYLRFAVF